MTYLAAPQAIESIWRMQSCGLPLILGLRRVKEVGMTDGVIGGRKIDESAVHLISLGLGTDGVCHEHALTALV